MVKCISFWLLKESQPTEAEPYSPIFPSHYQSTDCSDQQDSKYIIDIRLEELKGILEMTKSLATHDCVEKRNLKNKDKKPGIFLGKGYLLVFNCIDVIFLQVFINLVSNSCI